MLVKNINLDLNAALCLDNCVSMGEFLQESNLQNEDEC